ncbi:MAG: hypothetical protein JW741_08325 [Sedimentisphaerales bacterium]|nr:hypothetical protein [Sedimentisphaerales bacterium]
MGFLLSQLGPLAQQRPDTDEWVNVLFVVVVAVLYVVGALIKGAGGKAQKRGGQSRPAEGQRETWQQRLARKAEEVQRAAEAHTKEAAAGMRRLAEQAREQQAQSPRAATRPPSPPRGRLTTRPGRGGQDVLVYEQGTPESPSERQQRAARLRRPRQVTVEQQRVPQRQVVTEPARPLTRAPRASTAVPASSIIDYNDPDALKKAILLREILGKPVGLRDPFQPGAGL